MKIALTLFAAIAATLVFVLFFRIEHTETTQSSTVKPKPDPIEQPDSQPNLKSDIQAQGQALNASQDNTKEPEETTISPPITIQSEESSTKPEAVIEYTPKNDKPQSSPESSTTKISKDAWRDAGKATPEASLQTMFWHGIQEISPLDSTMVHWKEDTSLTGLENLDVIKDHMIKETITWIKNLDNYEITELNQIDPETQFMMVDFDTPNGPEARGITLIKSGDVWLPQIHIGANSLNWNHTSFERAP